MTFFKDLLSQKLESELRLHSDEPQPRNRGEQNPSATLTASAAQLSANASACGSHSIKTQRQIIGPCPKHLPALITVQSFN